MEHTGPIETIWVNLVKKKKFFGEKSKVRGVRADIIFGVKSFKKIFNSLGIKIIQKS